MKLELSVPSKTFLIGEYVALTGGPSLVLTTEPRFKLFIHSIAEEAISFSGIHPQSPAGKFLTHYESFYRGFHYTFADPHFGMGGFGASSAQFIMIYAYKYWLKTGQPLDVNDFATILKEYHEFAWDGLGIAPSGADVIAQIQGGISFFYPNKKQVEKVVWPFTEHSFLLIHTGNKLATHEHLQTLTLEFLTSKMEHCVLAAMQALQQEDILSLAQAIKEFSQQLQQHGLVAENTLNFLVSIEQQKGVVAAKGCGSLAADVILVIVDNQFLESFSAWVKQAGLQLVYEGQKVSAGLTII